MMDYSFTELPMPSWRITTEHIEVHLQSGPFGLSLYSMSSVRSGRTWKGMDSHTLAFLRIACEQVSPRWQMHTWTFHDDAQSARLRVEFLLNFGNAALRVAQTIWIAEDAPALRHWIDIENVGDARVDVIRCHVLDYGLAHELADAPVDLLYVDTLAGHRRDRWEPADYNFDSHELRLAAGDAFRLNMGAYQETCSWLAMRKPDGLGLVFGLEYDGVVEWRQFDVARVPGGKTWSTEQPLCSGMRIVAAQPDPLNVGIAPGDAWRSPSAFCALFEGAWDHAAHVTHALVEHHLAPPLPSPDFPYAMFDTWGYIFELTPERARRCVDIAADVGAEVFMADYGWFPLLGEWTSIERAFPPLQELRSRVRERGMKFGLWMSFANAHTGAAVLAEHDDWRVQPDDWGSFRSSMLCMGHAPTRAWAAEQAIRVIREYDVDHLKHDFELIRPCTHPGHSHPPDPSGYHSMRGYHEVLRAIRAACPHVTIENCQGGGRIMTYDMVKLHDTSIISDGAVLADPLGRRRALFGATYPFPLRFCNNYMEEHPTDYGCHSSMIGGPWILMGRADEWTSHEIDCARRNVALYKRIRPLFHAGKVHHLRKPDGARWDAYQIHHAGTERGVLYVFQPPLAREAVIRAALAGLTPHVTYRLTSSTSQESWTADGAILMTHGFECTLPAGQSDVILIERSE